MMVMMTRTHSSPTAAVTTIFLLATAHHFEGTTAKAASGYEYAGYGSCRDVNGNIYSNIRLTDATATHDDAVCGQSCDIFRSSDKLRGFEWLIVDGSSKRCYCLFDAGSDIEAMALSMGGDGATWKGDNDGKGEISSAENVGIDSYCHKLVPLVRLGDVSSPPPTPQPQSIEEIFEGIFGDEPVFTTSQVDDDEYEYNQNASPSPTLNTTKSSKIFAGYTGKTSKSKSTNKSHSSSMECSKSTKSGSDGSMYEKNEKKSSQSTKTKRCSSKSGKSSLSYPSVEGKADKGGDDPSLMILEQMRYKMGNGGRRSGGIELLLLMVTSITVSSYLVWQ
mmetsp:Transcript_13358/g.19997  ORF Transcript_13358/g.19997 Transcript_13358/m.19997 type:complete len:334 (-) Transcript_13358:183-1184(-)